MLWLLAGIILLVVLLVIAVQTSPVQNFIKDKAVSYLHGKLKTRVSIGHISIVYPKDISIDNLYLEDQRGDTLIAAGSVRLNITLTALLDSKVEISSAELDDLTSHITRTLPGGDFNFSFIPRAFASPPPSKPAKPDTSSLAISLGNISLHRIKFLYRDTITGYSARVNFTSLGAVVKKFDLKKMQFGISRLMLTGLDTRVRQLPGDTLASKAAATGAASSLTTRPSNNSFQSVALKTPPETVKSAASVNTASSVNPGPTPGIRIDLGSVILEHDKADFSSQVLKLSTLVNLDRLVLEKGSLDLGKQTLKLSSLELGHTSALLGFLKTATIKDSSNTAIVKVQKAGRTVVRAIRKNLDSAGKAGLMPATSGRSGNFRAGAALVAAPKPADSTGWKVDIGSINLHDDQFSLDNENDKLVARGLDYSHLKFTGLTLKTGKLHYEPAYTKVLLQELALRDKSGFELRHAAGDIYFSDRKTQADRVRIETAGSSLDASVTLGYASLSSLSKNIGALQVNADIRPSVVGLQELLYFQPGLATIEPFKKGGLRQVKFNGTATGTVSDLVVKKFEAAALNETHLLVKGRIRGLPDAKSLNLNVSLDDLSTGAADLNTMLDKGMLPASIQLPAHIRLMSTLKGSLQHMLFNAGLQTSLGRINTSGMLELKPRDTSYQVSLQATDIQAGSLLRNKDLGLISLQTVINGSGLSLQSASSTIQGRVQLAQYKGYSYKNLSLRGSISGRQLSLQAAMPDPNLSFSLNAKADLGKKIPGVSLQFRLDSSNLKVLKFSATTRRLRGQVEATIPSLDLVHPDGMIRLHDFKLVTDSASIPLDSLVLSLHSSGNQKDLEIQSEFAKASLTGQISLPDIAGQLEATLNSYYAFSAVKKKKTWPAEDFKFTAVLLGPPALHKLVPGLASFSPVKIDGNYNSLLQTLALNVNAPHTQYTDISIDSLRLHVLGDASKLTYALEVDSVSSSGFDLETTRISGVARNSQLSTEIAISDDKKKEKYQLAALISEHAGNYQFHLIPDGLLINYQPWKVAADNQVSYGKAGILARDLNLSNGNSSLKINSIRQEANSPVRVDFSRFDLATISKFLEKDSVLIRGELNGNVLADQLTGSPVFTSDLTLNDFSFKKDTLGSIHLKVDNKVKNTFTAAVSVSGHGNVLTLNGDYNTAGSSFIANLDIQKLTLASVQIYMQNQISHSRGYINGQLQLSGTVAKPQVNGSVGFRQLGFNLTYLNSDFTLPDQQIGLDASGIHFNHFLLLDSARNKLDLNGDVLTQDFRNYTFALNLSSKDFRVLNSKASENALFFGTVYLNSDINISGDLNKPKIDANITLNDKTRFTYVIPADDPSLQENNGIVQFVNYRDSVMKAPVKKPKSAFKGFDFSANLNVEKDAEFTVIIDPQTGDALKVKGQATLNTTIDASGKVSLTGRYEISQGSYQLSLNSFVKKTFSIQSGSTILWTGEPTSATVDLTAVYQANAPSIDLMEQQSDAETSAKYKQLLPFQLDLKMSGELLKPLITFSITLPERERNLNPDVQAQLDILKQDPSELNKQVFALLVLGRFVGQNPFQSASGGGVDAGLIARQSAGKIMSQQLNKIAGNLIKGVDLNFDVNSQNNYSSGEKTTQTDLKIGATKSFNDRLSVSVGSDIALEGSQSQASTSTLIGDVSVEYKLSRDGRYRLRAFRRNATQEYVEGQFIETGVSFILVLDYDKFQEIFRGKKKQQAVKSTRH